MRKKTIVKRTFNRKNRRKKKEMRQAQVIEDDFIRLIAPIGGVSYEPEYVRKGDGYETCIYVHQFTQNVNAGWINRLKISGVAINFSVFPQENIEVEKVIERSINEQTLRMVDPKSDTLDAIKAQRQISELNNLVRSLDGGGEVVFKVGVRLLLAEATFEKLEKKVEEVLSILKSYSYTGTILLNEQENEFKSLYRPSDMDTFYGRHGVAMPAKTFGAGFPYSFSQLSDPRGILLGFTDEGGSVIWDLFHVDAMRMYYNACIFGTMGAGKSTLIKKMLKNFAIVGHRIRSLDPVGETAEIAQEFGGKIISLDGKRDVLNPLDFRGSIEASLAKAEIFLKYMAPILDGHEIALFGDVLKDVYHFKLPRGEQPLFSDIQLVINHYLKQNTWSQNRRKQYENLEIQINRIVNSYGSLFNRASTIHTKDEDIVVFTMRALKEFGTSVYQAQMFNILSLLWWEMVEFGLPQKELFETGQLDIKDVKNFVIFADEAHNFLNAKNLDGIDYFVNVAREARKYFGGLVWASQLIHDAVSGLATEASEKIKALFELTQYKFMMKQDQNSLRHIGSIFENQITDVEIKQIPSFEKGEVLLNISGSSNFKLKIEATEEELAIFKGGR